MRKVLVYSLAKGGKIKIITRCADKVENAQVQDVRTNQKAARRIAIT